MASAFTGVGVELGLSCSTSKLLRSQTSPSRSSGCFVKMTVSVEDRRKKKNFTLQKSEEIFNAAKEFMPGGVNSPVRAFKSVGGQPIVMDSVKGSHMWDVDGNEYPALTSIKRDEPSCSISEVMDILRSINEIERGGELFMLAAKLFLKKENREMFVALKDVDLQIEWLKQMK